MDEDPIPAELNEEEFKKMEKDIDDFLSSIRENVSQGNDPNSEATCSGAYGECESISSEEFEHVSQSVISPPSSSELSVLKQGHRKGEKKWNKVHKGKKSNIGRKSWRGRRVSSLGNENYQGRRQPKDPYYTQRFVSLEEDESHDSVFSRIGKFHHGGSFSSSGNAHHPDRSISEERDEYYEEEVDLSPEEIENHQEDRLSSRRYRHKRRKIFHEALENNYENIYNSNLSCNRNPRSKSSETESMYHRIYEVESDSPDSENEEDEYDEDHHHHHHHDPYWEREEDYSYMEDTEGDPSFSGGSLDMSSIITACLEKVIASNPEIADRVTEACMSFSNKSVDTSYDSDYECEEGSHGSFVDQSNRVSLRSWRGSRSPSYTESLGSSSGPSGGRHHTNRYEGSHTRRIVVERSRSRSPEVHQNRHKEATRHSSNYDRKRSTASKSASYTSSTKRYSTKHRHKYHEEDPKKLVARSNKMIQKQCEGESDSTVRSALLVLLEVHKRECDMYLRKTEAHPDYNKEYRIFLDKKTRSIIDLGGDPNGYDFQREWRKYWPAQLTRVFRESWDAKMQKCVHMLQKRGHVSVSLLEASRKEVTKSPSEKTQKTNVIESAEINTKKCQKESKKIKDIEEQKESEAAPETQCKTKEEVEDAEILSILKLLSHIKHKFKDCEASFISFYKKALSLKQRNFNLYDYLQGNLPLLQDIDDNLNETLKDEQLTLIQKVIIQETHERFKVFLNKSKEIYLLSMKDKDSSVDTIKTMQFPKESKICVKNSSVEKIPETFVPSTPNADGRSVCNIDEKQHIPCLITKSHPPLNTLLHSEQGIKSSYGCEKILPISRSIRTLTQISIKATSHAGRDAPNLPQDGSKSANSLPSTKEQGGSLPSYKTDAESVIKDSDKEQPPPPGITSSPSDTASPLPDTTSPPVTSATPASHTITFSSVSVAPSTPVTHPCQGLISQPSTMSIPHTTLQPPTSTTPTLVNVTPPSNSITPPPLAVASHSTPPPLSQVSSQSHSSRIVTSQSCQVSNLHRPKEASSQATKHLSKLPRQNNESTDNKDIATSQTETAQQTNRELLRSTIKDCFQSPTSHSKENNVTAPKAEKPLMLDNKDEEASVTSVSSVTDDVLKMFVVKPEDINERESNKPSADLTTSEHHADNDVKVAKKPIKITIPQFPKRRNMPSFNPSNDDHELL